VCYLSKLSGGRFPARRTNINVEVCSMLPGFMQPFRSETTGRRRTGNDTDIAIFFALSMLLTIALVVTFGA
jgi:hypothetical protein